MRLDEIFTFDIGHVCHSEPKKITNFYLVPVAETSTFIDLQVEVLNEVSSLLRNLKVYNLRAKTPGKC